MYSRSDQPALGMSGVMDSNDGIAGRGGRPEAGRRRGRRRTRRYGRGRASRSGRSRRSRCPPGTGPPSSDERPRSGSAASRVRCRRRACSTTGWRYGLHGGPEPGLERLGDPVDSAHGVFLSSFMSSPPALPAGPSEEAPQAGEHAPVGVPVGVVEVLVAAEPGRRRDLLRAGRPPEERPGGQGQAQDEQDGQRREGRRSAAVPSRPPSRMPRKPSRHANPGPPRARRPAGTLRTAARTVMMRP